VRWLRADFHAQTARPANCRPDVPKSDPAQVTPELQALLLTRVGRHNCVFVGKTGEPPTQESVSSYITRVMRAIGLPGSRTTRCAIQVTLMLEAGVIPRVIQKLAGWTSLRTLERHGHARYAEAQRAVTGMHATLEQALKQPDAPRPHRVINPSRRGHIRGHSVLRRERKLATQPLREVP
jgi:hypothetical protein